MKPLVPTSPVALRICDIFHRRHTTPWQPKEVRAYKAIAKHIEEEDLAMVERCYKSQWPPNRDKNILRHDIYTWLNNYATEVDRARIWCDAHPLKPKPRVIVPMYSTETEPLKPLTDPAEIAAYERFEAERLRRKQAKGGT